VATTDEIISISQLFGGTCPGYPQSTTMVPETMTVYFITISEFCPRSCQSFLLFKSQTDLSKCLVSGLIVAV